MPIAHRLFPLALVLAAPAAGTTCTVSPPCASLGPNKALFVGEVASGPLPVAHPVFVGLERYRYRVRVREAFIGLDPDLPEVEAMLPGAFEPGTVIFVEAVRDAAGQLESPICSLTGLAGERDSRQMVAFLRERKLRRPEGSLNVIVASPGHNYRPLSGVRVVADGPIKREATTQKGRAHFRNLPPGRYAIRVSKQGYREAERPSETSAVVVPPYGCPGAYIRMEPR